MLDQPKCSQSILIAALLLALLVAPPPWAFLLRPGAASASSLSTLQEPNEPQVASLKEVTVSAGDILINEVMFQPGPGGAEWVELKNRDSTALNLDGYELTDEDGNWYRLPSALPNVPAGAFIVVHFDGQGSGSDDYNFSDNRATLHTPAGLVNIFEDEADQVALYRNNTFNHTAYLPLLVKNFLPWNPSVPGPPADFLPSPLIAFVAWGAAPGDDANEAAAAGLWSQDWSVSPARGLGFISPEVLLAPNESLGLLPGSQTSYLDDWTLFQVSEVSPGGQNPLPVISWYNPPTGTTLDRAAFGLSWMPIPHATGYAFQLDDNLNFGSPLVNTTLTEPRYLSASAIAEGAYYWRVKALFVGGESAWTPRIEIRTLSLSSFTTAAKPRDIEKTLDITWLIQHKDTKMLSLEGHDETGPNRWDGPTKYDASYCARAAVAMMASFYGGKLSQDRIAYEMFKGGSPEGDFGHGSGFRFINTPLLQRDHIGVALSWALGGAPITRIEDEPTFEQIKAWIDAGQPILRAIPGHAQVIDGYNKFDRTIRVLDPSTGMYPVVLGNTVAVWVGPAGAGGAPNVKSDEDADRNGVSDTMDDSDEDGVVDFDEVKRFELIPNNPDTDGDLVRDKAEIREYVFDGTDADNRKPDPDGDGKRKERDPDNDYFANDGTIDGCEDSNQNGKYEKEAGETHNFNPSDDKNLHLQLNWPKLGADVDLHLIKPGSTMGAAGDVFYGNRNPDWSIPGQCGNPTLDQDCTSGCTVENIRLDKLENGDYTVKVHYYSNHGQGDTSPSVTFWLQDKEYNFGPRQLSNGQIWNVATIRWPAMTVIQGSLITDQSLEELPFKPE